jgi:hypothetical protein
MPEQLRPAIPSKQEGPLLAKFRGHLSGPAEDTPSILVLSAKLWQP